MKFAKFKINRCRDCIYYRHIGTHIHYCNNHVYYKKYKYDCIKHIPLICFKKKNIKGE